MWISAPSCLSWCKSFVQEREAYLEMQEVNRQKTLFLGSAAHFWERRVTEVTPVEERRRIRLRRPNSVEVSVADSGGGIAPEHQQGIFEEFVRLDRTSPGVGLGLAIAKRFIQAHAGKIWVESEQSHGSRFVFLLPMDQN
jgi:light-regulated signal transduction histidine kinase (bacteriophytochrome)